MQRMDSLAMANTSQGGCGSLQEETENLVRFVDLDTLPAPARGPGDFMNLMITE